MKLPDRLLLFDGECAMCDATVQWVLDHDRDGVFSFAPLQGETAAALRARHPEITKELESLVLVETEAGSSRVYLRSEAVFRIFAQLAGPWRWLAWLRWLPGAWADYWILHVDADYANAVVGTPDRKCLWLLSRNPHASEAQLGALRALAESRGYETEDLEPTPHSGA